MPAPILAIQYLEDSPELLALDKTDLVERLQLAAAILPFSHLLVGWHLPQHTLEALRLEAEQLGLRFLLWLPLLTMDKLSPPDNALRVASLAGHPVQGYKSLPEFTFVCPNHPATREAVLTRLESLVRSGIYQGFFLDRVRFPSPAHDPINTLACFCAHCRQKAAEIGLDLLQIQQVLTQHVRREGGRIKLVSALLGNQQGTSDQPADLALRRFISFRQKSITEFLALVTRPLRDAHSEIGLDCFSPSLAVMVGQDIGHLGSLADWVKLMTYLHTFAPAGLPYELAGLLEFLTHANQSPGVKILELVSRCTGLALPPDLHTLEKDGLMPGALYAELMRGLQATSAPVLAGIELVDLPGVTSLNNAQIQADLDAISRAQPAGLAISWDLLHIPLDRLKLVAQVYLGKG